MSTTSFRKSSFFRYISFTVLAAFVGMLPVQPGYAQVAIVMPPIGQMIHVTRHFEPPQMVGLKINLKDPFSFGFIMDQGESPMSDVIKKKEFNKIINYFLVSLAMPNKDMWVNLSPYESKRIIPEVFGQTEMGRDLLAQDYILKQFTASLMYPDDGLGKEFWDRVYSQAQARFGTTDINVNTFNKVWIVADHADVYQKGDTAFLVGSHLKVMLEQDFKAIEQNKEQFGDVNAVGNDSNDAKTQMASQIVREIIIPAIEKEVNEGQSFAAVRQIYNAEIMATWFKKTLRASLLGQVFADKSKIAGQKVSDPQAKEKIFQQYLLAYKRGVFNFIRQEATSDGQIVPRRYLSGGVQQVLPAQVRGFNDADIAASLEQETQEVKALIEKLKDQKAQMIENFTMPSDSTITPMDLVYRIARMPVSDDSRNIMMAALVSHITNPDIVDNTARAESIRALATEFKEQNIAGLKNVEALKNFIEKQLALAKPSSSNQPNEPLAKPTVDNLLKMSSLPGVMPYEQNMMLATVMHELTKPTPSESAEVADTAAKLQTGANDKTLNYVLTDFVLNSQKPQAPAESEAPILPSKNVVRLASGDIVRNTAPEKIEAMLNLWTNNNPSSVDEYRKLPSDKQKDYLTNMLVRTHLLGGSDLGVSMDNIQRDLEQQVKADTAGFSSYFPFFRDNEPRLRGLEGAGLRNFLENNDETKNDIEAAYEAINGIRLVQQAARVSATKALESVMPDSMKSPVDWLGPIRDVVVERVMRHVADAALVAQREVTTPAIAPAATIDTGSLLSRIADMKDQNAKIRAMLAAVAVHDAENPRATPEERQAAIPQMATAFEKQLSDENLVPEKWAAGLMAQRNMPTAALTDTEALLSRIADMKDQNDQIRAMLAAVVLDHAKAQAGRAAVPEMAVTYGDQLRENPVPEKWAARLMAEINSPAAATIDTEDLLSRIADMKDMNAQLRATLAAVVLHNAENPQATRAERQAAIPELATTLEKQLATKPEPSQWAADLMSQRNIPSAATTDTEALLRRIADMKELNVEMRAALAAEVVDHARAQAGRAAVPEMTATLGKQLSEENLVPEKWAAGLMAPQKSNAEDLGGINLSDEHLTMNIKVDGAGMPLPPQYQDKALMNLNGLVSIIRSITPLTQQNVPALYDLTK